MTRDISPDLEKIRLYLTEPHPCSYLPDRQATTAFVDPKVVIDVELYNRLSDLGFRRSGKPRLHAALRQRQGVHPDRIDATGFSPSRPQRKCLYRNRDIAVALVEQVDIDEHYPLYEAYISARHQDGDMYPPSRAQYQDFIGCAWHSTGSRRWSFAFTGGSSVAPSRIGCATDCRRSTLTSIPGKSAAVLAPSRSSNSSKPCSNAAVACRRIWGSGIATPPK